MWNMTLFSDFIDPYASIGLNKVINIHWSTAALFINQTFATVAEQTTLLIHGSFANNVNIICPYEFIINLSLRFSL